MSVLEEFLSEAGRQEQADAVARWRAAEREDPWPADALDAMREEIADAVRTLRVEQRVLVNELSDTLIKWTIGTGIVVVSMVIAVLKLL